ncbi:GNAT family N-acetyltransferase [Corynebacterium sp. UBA2622]|uniref:GNAT family N-acetyltransferase n=1 Tax=Corynebacterium sp. UBA2622 TaxID=1946393 RepID=UPI0025C0841D|nr:GNAT family N-acetyltransferase [Corynebacterium sp. UBA2622]
MPELVRPTVGLRESFLGALDEWGWKYQDGTGIRDAELLRCESGFARWVDALLAEETQPWTPGYVACSYYWIVEEGEFAGAIALRHELTEHLLTSGGHVGYSVRPSRRRRGLATFALREIIPIARERGMGPLLLTCAEDNVASRKVIRANGGIYEDTRFGPDGRRMMRFWVPTTP